MSSRLEWVVAALRDLYGAPPPPPSDPFANILRENVTYLADDARRTDAFRILREATGLDPRRLLALPRPALRAIAARGILPDQAVEKLREIAALALEEFGGDLDAVVALPAAEAARALRKFPSIGQPGAEKILLFARRLAVLALESNGLRVLLRVGYGKEEKSYSASYRSAQSAAAAELPADYGVLIAAHQLLKRHGVEICRRSKPQCERCPVARRCDYFGRSSVER
ncbi:MAG: hypothetical protein ABJC61_06195 [Acidobacteriota bacterium]